MQGYHDLWQRLHQLEASHCRRFEAQPTHLSELGPVVSRSQQMSNAWGSRRVLGTLVRHVEAHPGPRTDQTRWRTGLKDNVQELGSRRRLRSAAAELCRKHDARSILELAS